MNSIKYVAFLRGINVGGNTKVPMVDLKNSLEGLGFKGVWTVLNSGNVVFEAEEQNINALTQTIEKKLEEIFAFNIIVLLRTFVEIQELIQSNPFKGIPVTPQTRLYVTFLSEIPNNNLKIPYHSLDFDFRIIELRDRAIFSVLVLSPSHGTTESMNIMEKEFGKKVTTRNWNTILKLKE